MLSDSLFGYLLAAIFSGGGVFLVFMYLFIRYPENMERIASMFLKIVAYFSKKAEKKRITTYINSNMEIGRKHIEKIVHGVMPFGMRVEFIENAEEDIIEQQDNILILKMKSHKNDSENLARVASYYVSHGLLPYSKQYLDNQISRSIDFIVGKKLIIKNKIAIDHFRKLYEDLFEDEDKRKILEKTEKVDEEGFLTRICLREYQKFSVFYPREPSNDTKHESKEFMNKIYEIVTKKTRERIDLSFKGRIIKVRVVPLMSYEHMDITNHYYFIQKSVELGWEAFYIIAAGKNINEANKLVDLLISDYKLQLTEEFRDIYKGKYKGKEKMLFCSLLRRKNND